LEEQLANGVKARNKSFFKYIRSKEPAKKSAGPRDGEDVRETLREEKVTQMNYLHHRSQGEPHAVPAPERFFGDGGLGSISNRNINQKQEQITRIRWI